MLRIAIQSKGRLFEDTMALLQEAGIKLNTSKRTLLVQAANFPVEVLFLRDDDIPQTVASGVADLGIVGENEFYERREKAHVVRHLGFSKCRLSLAIPKDEKYEGIEWFQGKRIATSYPRILTRILEENGVKATPVVVSGSVEITVDVGIADAIADLVSTGTTLNMNGLEEAECIYRSSAIMIARPDMSDEKKMLLARLLERIDAVMMARHKKYILFNLPADRTERAAAIIGGMKSPTVTPLMDKGWVSVQSAVDEDRFWAVFEELRKLGAEGILVMNIEKMTE